MLSILNKIRTFFIFKVKGFKGKWKPAISQKSKYDGKSRFLSLWISSLVSLILFFPLFFFYVLFIFLLFLSSFLYSSTTSISFSFFSYFNPSQSPFAFPLFSFIYQITSAARHSQRHKKNLQMISMYINDSTWWCPGQTDRLKEHKCYHSLDL